MPFIDEQPILQNLSNIPLEPEQKAPAVIDTFRDAFLSGNMVASYFASRGMPDPGEVEEGFNAIDYVKDDPEFAPDVEAFAGIMNRKAADAQKIQVRAENERRKNLAAAGATGVIASMAAGFFDLPTLIPVGGAASSFGRSAWRTAARTAVAGGIDASVSEAGLHLTQATRTGEETVYNVGGSVLLGGALGGLAGRYLSKETMGTLSKKIEGQEKGYREFDDAVFKSPSSVAGAQSSDKGALVLKDEAIIKRLPIVSQQDPLIRLQLSEFDSARQAVRQMAETPLEYADNAKGVATELGGSVETRIKMWSAPHAQTLNRIDTAYAKYFHGIEDPSSLQVKLSPLKSEFASRSGGQKLTYKMFKEEVGKAAFSGEKHAIPEVEEAARAYRSIDESMKKAAIEAKLLPEDIAVKNDVSHLFRMYNKEKIVARRKEFGDILQAHFVAKRNAIQEIEAKGAEVTAKIDKGLEDFSRMSDAEVRDVVEETINTILGNADGHIPFAGIVSGPRGPLKERVLQIESSKIQDFMDLDIEEVLAAQIRTVAPDVELARKFGSVDLKEQIRKINDEADFKISQATDEKRRILLEKQRKHAIRDVEGIRDRLRGQYALPSTPDGMVLRAGRVVRNLNYLRLLGGMTVSAIPDLGKIVFTHGLASTFKDGFVPLIKNLKAFRLAAEEVKLAGTALDMVLDSRAMSMADITGDFGRHSAFERGIKAASSRFGVVSLMAPWNASAKQFAGMVTMTNILRASKRIADGTATPKDIRNLAAASIDADTAKKIASEFAKHGDEQSGVLLAKAADWGDSGAREAFRAAVVREVDKIVVTPGQDKPLWMSTELGKTIGQFRTFGVSSMQKTTLAGLQQRDAATLNGIMVMLGLGAVTYWAKESIAGREVSDNPMQWAVEAADKSGLLAYIMDANNIVEKATRGRVGTSALTGEEVSRYSSRNVYGAFLGPSADAVADVFQLSGSIFAGDMSKSDLHKARQLLPLQNLFYIRGLFNQVEGAAGDALDLPDTRR